MNKTFNWGIIGPGRIAHKFALGLKAAPGAKLFAIASRSTQRAETFARQYQAERFYGNYRSLAADPEVDIIYIATPHSAHYENTLMCLEEGKPVLCEKPFTINAKQLHHLVEVARNNKVFLMEAFWTRFLPTIIKTLEIRDSGTMADIKAVHADFGFLADFDPQWRLFNPALGGGALLDIGVYPVFLSLLMMGKPDKLKAISSFSATGVDESTSIIFKHENGNMANLTCTVKANTPIQADIIFEKGRIRINTKWIAPSSLTLVKEDGSKEEITFIEKGNGYQYQAIECMRCLDTGLTESPLMSLDFSLSLMELMDQIRKECGIVYPDYD